MLVSFQDKLTFRARHSNTLNHCHVRYLSPRTPQAQVINKAYRGVDYTPRYHQTRLSSAKFTFRGATCTKPHQQVSIDYNSTQTRNETVKRSHSTKDTKKISKDCLPQVKQKDFERKFRPLKPHDDAVSRVQTWKSIMMVGPYTNPKPYDHRGLDDALEETRLQTLTTPDPYNTRLKTRGLSEGYKSCYTDPLEKYSTRDIDFRFNTFKTPEPHYDSSLLFATGRYSPAFTAYNAYLDRVNKTVLID